VLAHIFGNMKLKPAYERFLGWKNRVGEDGVAVGQGLGIACSSPMHFIQKTLIGSTDFYYHYHDYKKEMGELADSLENSVALERSQQLLCTLLEELKLNYLGQINRTGINALIRELDQLMVPAEASPGPGTRPEDQSQSPPAATSRLN